MFSSYLPLPNVAIELESSRTAKIDGFRMVVNPDTHFGAQMPRVSEVDLHV